MKVVVIVMVVVVEGVVKVMVVVVCPRELVFVQRFVQEFCAATGWTWEVWGGVLGRPLDQRVGVGRCVSVAKVGAVPTPADAPGHSGLLNGLANHDTVLLKLLRENGVQEGIATRIEG